MVDTINKGVALKNLEEAINKKMYGEKLIDGKSPSELKGYNFKELDSKYSKIVASLKSKGLLGVQIDHEYVQDRERGIWGTGSTYLHYLTFNGKEICLGEETSAAFFIDQHKDGLSALLNLAGTYTTK